MFLQHNMKKTSLAISLIGILIILTSINLLPIKEHSPEEISQKDIGKKISLTGIPSNIKTYENNFTTFKINNLKITCNCPNLKTNQTLKITGKISQYQKQLQLEASKIEIVN